MRSPSTETAIPNDREVEILRRGLGSNLKEEVGGLLQISDGRKAVKHIEKQDGIPGSYHMTMAVRHCKLGQGTGEVRLSGHAEMVTLSG